MDDKQLLEGIDARSKSSNFMYGFHRAGKSGDLAHYIDVGESIFKNGFQPGGGMLYGQGLYSTIGYDDQFNSKFNMEKYGHTILEYKVPKRYILIFDYVIAKILKGSKFTLIDQIVDSGMMKLPDIPAGLKVLSEDLMLTLTNRNVSADRAYHVWTECYIFGSPVKSCVSQFSIPPSKTIATKYAAINDKGNWGDKRAYGICFSGKNDGNVMVLYPKGIAKAIPTRYQVDNPKGRGTDPKDIVLPWTVPAGGKSTLGTIIELQRQTVLDSGLIAKQLVGDIVDIIFEDAKNLTPQQAVDAFRKASVDNFMASPDIKASDLVRKVDAYSKMEIVEGIWKKGLCKPHTLSSSVMFDGGTFAGDYFFGNFRAGIFESGKFSGQFYSGQFNLDSAIWVARGKGGTAELMDSSKTAAFQKVIYKGKLYSLDGVEPDVWLDNFNAQKGIAEFNLNVAISKALKIDERHLSISPQFLSTLAGSNAREQFDSLVKQYPWLFGTDRITVKECKIQFEDKDKIALIGGVVTFGVLKFSQYTAVNVHAGVITGPNTFETSSSLSGGRYEEGTFKGNFYGGEINLTKANWVDNVAQLRIGYGNKVPFTFITSKGKLPAKGGLTSDWFHSWGITDVKGLLDFIAASPANLQKAKMAIENTVSASVISSPDNNFLSGVDDSLPDGTVLESVFDVSNDTVSLEERAAILEEEYSYQSLSNVEQGLLYDAFRDSYIKATGAAFDEDAFTWRAKSWSFFGVAPNDKDPNSAATTGGIAVRKQPSGLIKFVASFGNFRGVFAGMKELIAKDGDKPIWGMMSADLVKMMIKFDKSFKTPPGLVTKAMEPVLKKISNGEVKSVGLDGGAMVDTPSGPMKKFLVGNTSYWKQLLDNATDPSKANKLPVPQAVLAPAVGALKLMLGVK